METDPLNKDSDGDGINDGEEVNQGSDPHDSEDDAPPPETQVAQIELTGRSMITSLMLFSTNTPSNSWRP